jgi:hypothetical protein
LIGIADFLVVELTEKDRGTIDYVAEVKKVVIFAQKYLGKAFLEPKFLLKTQTCLISLVRSWP